MAINYLNSLDLNKNYINNAAIQNLAAEPTADTPGQIYFNTVSQTLRITEEILPATNPKTYQWVSVSGDITALIAGTDIDITDETGPIPTINHADITRSDTATADAPAYGGTFTAVDTITTSATGHVTAVNVKTVTLPTIAYDLNKAAASGNLVLSKDGTAQDTIAFAGTGGQIEIDIATEDSYTFKFPAAGVILPNGSTATTQATGDNSTKVATTAFVQSAVTGLLEFKGGFDATTGELDDGSGNDLYTDVVIAVGDYYVVTTAGNFFGNTATPLTVGDSVIAQNAVPDPGTTAPTEADFIVVQSDTDLATATTVGLGNVVPGTSATVTAPYTSGTATIDVVDSTAIQKGAVIVAESAASNLEGIDVSYSSGTASVGLDIQGLTADAGTGDPITNFSVPFFSSPDDQNFKITLAQIASLIQTNNSYSGTIGNGVLTSIPIVATTHLLGSDSSSFMVQLVDDSSGETVYSDVTRGAAGLVTIDFSAAPAQDAIRVLIQKIG
jgi:hypothetical protein